MSTQGSRSASDWSRRLVASLVEKGIVTADSGDSSLDEAANRGVPVAMVLAQRGLIDTRSILEEMSALSGVANVDIVAELPSRDAFSLVPEMLAREIGAVGYRVEDDKVTLACMEPIANQELRHLSEFLGREVVVCVLADPTAIDRAMATVYPQLATDKRPPAAPAGVDGKAVHLNGSAAAPAANGGAPESAASPDDRAFETVAADQAVAPSPTEPFSVESENAFAPVLVDSSPEDDGDVFGELGGGGIGFSAGAVDLDALLTYAVDNGASDLHLATELPPTIRIDGSLRPIEGLPTLDNETIREMIYRVLTQRSRERFEATKELDTSHMIHGVGRFRVNVFQQRGSIGAVLRSIPHDIPDFESLGLPDVVSSFAELRRGLVLVTGPTGSGKSTSLASLVSIINHSKPLHIVTVEDPIEFLHRHSRAIINQREVGVDTESFAEALRHVLRQDPDVILIGEMRDIETIQTALTAAETGHLVFATLHTQDAPQTIDRIIDVFPTAQQHQVRIQLAGTLEAVVTQQLILSATGLGRVPVAEVMVCTPAIRNLIRQSKTHQVYSLMQTGGAQGMQTMDQGLARAVRAGLITEAIAFDRCHDPSELRDYLKS